MAIKLRVISQEMLDRRAHALTLHALDVGDRHARGEEGVFAKVLKVSSVHRSPVDVDPRRQEKVYAFGASVTSEFGSDKLRQRRIPRSGQRNASGKSSSWSKVADADGSVGHLQSRQVKTRNVANEKTVDASEQVKFFFERHLLKDRVDPALDLSQRPPGRRWSLR